MDVVVLKDCVIDAELEQMVTMLRDEIAEQTAIGTAGANTGAQDGPSPLIGRRPTLIQAD